MSETTNPMLLDPNASTAAKVVSTVSMTKPLPVETVDESKFYFCTLPNHHMHRTDGKRLAFVFNILKTNDKYDIEYMDAEVSTGNPFVRLASEQEINVYNMRVDPSGTIKAQIKPKIEEDVRRELSLRLQAVVTENINKLDIGLTDEQKAALLDSMTKAQQLPATTSNDAAKIATTDTLGRLSEALSGGVQSGTGRLLGLVGTDKLPNAAG